MLNYLSSVRSRMTLSWQRLKLRFRENRRRYLLRFFWILVAGSLFMIVGVNLFPHPSNKPNTSLNTPNSFGDQGKMVQITKRLYNPESGTAQFDFQVNDDAKDNNNNSFIDFSKVNVDVTATHGGDQLSGTIIQTSTNTLTVQFSHLDKNFTSLEFDFKDKSVNVANVQAPKNVQDAKAHKGTSKEKENGPIIVNRDGVKIDQNLKKKNQKQLAINSYEQKIADQKQLIIDNQQAIKKYQLAIKDQQEKLQVLQNQPDFGQPETKQSQIQSQQDQINSIQINITSASQNIDSAKQTIQQYKDVQKQIESGTFKLLKPKQL
ncbi:hypothetical protein [Fructobacillus fructosus]|uniref:Uncharacterized protein n=1 Tax=Fructobacillus fructosus TaxID=1631 RepID=A0ABM9MPG0_9LACO|nr:hypothetical protein [Fructobacillus fructosus]MBC9118388.1 hypothetical protein [Fructobacillus fructosus]MBD9364609.1 hypothetical protein [Leuconostoc mesenteroides]CAK1229925.1 hypothetical protein R54839_PPFHFPJH_00379 [Fructobacillus fructosus]